MTVRPAQRLGAILRSHREYSCEQTEKPGPQGAESPVPITIAVGEGQIRTRSLGDRLMRRNGFGAKGTVVSKNLVIGAMVGAGIVALAAVADMAGVGPFGSFNIVVDILFILAAAIILYLGYTTYREIA